MTMWMINKEKFLKYKKKAAEYLYVHATKLYESNNISQIRRALEEKIEYLELKLQNAKRGNK